MVERNDSVEHTHRALMALETHLIVCIQYTRSFTGTPPYIHSRINSIQSTLHRLTLSVQNLDDRLPGHYYAPRQPHEERSTSLPKKAQPTIGLSILKTTASVITVALRGTLRSVSAVMISGRAQMKRSLDAWALPDLATIQKGIEAIKELAAYKRRYPN